ncbi:HIT family protein [Candidatus Woesearchaeota archaeon]|nr:HIT family protein [Candidatus Woesearchaeota archaeon]
MDCIFCKIVNKQIPSALVYEDPNFLAFLDISPANKGHALVIPKQHYETYTDLPDNVLKELAVVTKKVAEAINKSLNPDGLNIFMNNKQAAGQIVPHAHYHIVPRFKNDGIRFEWPHKKYDDGENKVYAEKIRNSMQ